tara:strand:+ start:2195 stop:3517 length:1323 start_codon:yes stop_codon:yes gene_type:complete
MISDILKKILGKIFTIISPSILIFGTTIKSPLICSLAWSLSIYQLNNLSNLFPIKKNKEKRKKILVLYRAYGINDFEYILNEEKNKFEFLFFSRNNIKLIYNSFFSGHKIKLSDNEYFTDNPKIIKAKEDYKNFLKEILKVFLKRNDLSAVVSFNFRYHTEKELHNACKELGLLFVVCQKESLVLKSEKDFYIEINSKNGRFNGHYMTVYTEDYKKLLVDGGICLPEKIFVIGMPRADFYFKKKDNQQRHILFLIPTVRQPYGHEGEILFDKDKLTTGVTKTLVEFAKQNPNENIVLKSKIYYQNEKNQELILNSSKLKNCKFVKGGDSRELINSAKIVIGFNSTALIESLILKKNIILPYFDVKDKNKFFRHTLEINEFARLAYSPDELMDFLNKICQKKLGFPDVKQNYLDETIKRYIGNTDGKSSLRLISTLNGIIN